MTDAVWEPKRPELQVPYDPEQRELYERDDPTSVFFPERWPVELRSGRQRDGRFPEIAVRASFRAIGYSVLLSEPRMPDGEGFILAHYAGMREAGHEAYKRMLDFFEAARLEEFNRLADRAKLAATGNRGGGDPDLFVFRSPTDRFFVEVKDEDQLHTNQLVTFPLIETILDYEVRLARLRPVPESRPDSLQLADRADG